MRIRLALITIFILSLAKGFSQEKDSIPAPGQIDKKDLQMTVCAFDSSAEAMVLFDVGKMVFKDYAIINTNYTRHVRIKILSFKGLEQARIKIPYLKGERGEKLMIEEAQTFNLNANGNVIVSRLDKKNIADSEINPKLGEKSFTLPDAREGSVIEYSYKVEGFIWTGLRDWHFQKSIPVKFSRYTTQFPNGLTLRCYDYCSYPVLKQKTLIWSDTVHSFTMTDLPALRPEPFMTSLLDYSQRIVTTVDTVKDGGRMQVFPHTWRFFSWQLMRDETLGKQLLMDLPNTEAMASGLKSITDSIRRMIWVYYYVKNNMHWNDQNSFGSQQGIVEAWNNKKGSNGEINLILINLLNKAGLHALPLMVSTHDHGRLKNSKPSREIFNRLMAYVNVNDQDFVLDASDPFSSPTWIPWDVQLSNQLVIYSNGMVDPHHWGQDNELKFFWDKKAAFKEVVQIQGAIDEAGLLSGDANVTSYEYSREKKIKDLQKSKDQYLNKYFIAGNPAIHIDSSSFVNEKVDSLPLKQEVWFNEKLNSTGTYLYFSPNLFAGFDKNPFTASQRISDIFFGAGQNYNIVENIFIPDGYKFDAIPKNISIGSADGTIVATRNINTQSDMVSIHISVEFKTPFYLAFTYPDFKAFYENMFTMLNEQIVIKKIKG
jgi:hypothetical protein